MSKMIARIVFVLVVSLSSRAQAFIGSPTLDPPKPLAGQVVSVDIYAGVCDAFTVDPPVITRAGNNIGMLLQSISNPPSSDFCILPTGTYVFPLGSFQAGTYLLRVDRVYMGFTGGTVTETLGVLSFTVTNPASSVPALGLSGTLVLILMLLGVSVSALRRRVQL